jgi:hypothetical protein
MSEDILEKEKLQNANPLTEKEERFCLEYHSSQNGTDAYFRVNNGECSRLAARSRASRWLDDPRIQARLLELHDEEQARRVRIINATVDNIIKLIQENTSVIEIQIKVIGKKWEHYNRLNPKDVKTSDIKNLTSAQMDVANQLRELRNLQLECVGVEAIEAEIKKKIKSGEYYQENESVE